MIPGSECFTALLLILLLFRHSHPNDGRSACAVRKLPPASSLDSRPNSCLSMALRKVTLAQHIQSREGVLFLRKRQSLSMAHRNCWPVLPAFLFPWCLPACYRTIGTCQERPCKLEPSVCHNLDRWCIQESINILAYALSREKNATILFCRAMNRDSNNIAIYTELDYLLSFSFSLQHLCKKDRVSICLPWPINSQQQHLETH